MCVEELTATESGDHTTCTVPTTSRPSLGTARREKAATAGDGLRYCPCEGESSVRRIAVWYFYVSRTDLKVDRWTTGPLWAEEMSSAFVALRGVLV